MKHQFDQIIISVYGFCEICQKVNESRISISRNQLHLQKIASNAEKFRSFLLEEAYKELEESNCGT